MIKYIIIILRSKKFRKYILLQIKKKVLKPSSYLLVFSVIIDASSYKGVSDRLPTTPLNEWINQTNI